MREFTKSVVSYTWSSSLFGLQQMASFLTPQGWLKTDPRANSLHRVAEATKKEMGSVAASTFRVGDNLQRGSIDMMFYLFSLGSAGCGQSGSSQPESSDRQASSTVSNLGGQVVGVLCQGLEALGQTAGVVGQAMGGMAPGQGCGGCSPTQTGWGPVRPPSDG